MTTQELVKYVSDLLTGGGMVPLNVKEEVVGSFVQDGVERVSDYYKETAVFETVTVQPSSGGTGNSGFVDMSTFSKPVHIVETVISTKTPFAGLSMMQEMAGLLGLERSVIMDSMAVDYAQWRQVRKDLVKSVGRDMSFRLVRTSTGKKLFVDDATPTMRVTVVYAPLPTDLSQITYGPAINWVKDWTMALTEIAQSKVMGRVGADTLGFSLNAGSLGDSGSRERDRLLEMLPGLHHSYGSTVRR